MATILPATLARGLYGGELMAFPFPEIGALQLPAGDFVRLLDAGFNIGNITGANGGGNLLGILIEQTKNRPAGSSLTYSLVVPFSEGTVIAMNMGNTVLGVPFNIQQSDLGELGGVSFISGGFDRKVVALRTTTNVRMRIIGFLDPVGEPNGRVLVTILPASRQLTN